MRSSQKLALYGHTQKGGRRPERQPEEGAESRPERQPEGGTDGRAAQQAQSAQLSQSAQSAEAPSAASADRAAELCFGARLLKQKSKGLFHWIEEYQELQLGSCRFSSYLPLHIGAIQELALWPKEQQLHPEDLLFFDTETIGLSRGSGNFAFLVGYGYFRQQHLMLEQFYLQEPAAEEAMLASLQKLFQSHRCLISYNGRAFDLPLLKNRTIINRMPPIGQKAHIDLLHIMRRLFPYKSLGSYRQADLEQELLGFERRGDLPGAEIPQIYFNYTRYGYDSGMGQILEHNSLDLQGMVLLFLEAMRLYNTHRHASGNTTGNRNTTGNTAGIAAGIGAGNASGNSGRLSQSALRSGIARLLLKNRREQESLELLAAVGEGIKEHAGESSKGSAETGSQEGAEASSREIDRRDEIDGRDGRQSELRYRDLRLLAHLYRRRKDYMKAVNILEELIRHWNCSYSRLSLAKLLEHRLGDLPAALRETEDLLKQTASNAPLSLLSLTRRRERILRKMSMQSAPLQKLPGAKEQDQREGAEQGAEQATEQGAEQKRWGTLQ